MDVSNSHSVFHILGNAQFVSNYEALQIGPASLTFLGNGKDISKITVISEGKGLSVKTSYPPKLGAIYLSGRNNNVSHPDTVLTFKDINANITVDSTSGPKDGDYSAGAGVIVSKLRQSSNENDNTSIVFDNSHVELNLNLEKYKKGTAAAIALSGYRRDTDSSIIKSTNSDIIINSTLGGIYLEDIPVDIQNSNITINAGLGFKDSNFLDQSSLPTNQAYQGAGISLQGNAQTAGNRSYEYLFQGGSLNVAGAIGIYLKRATYPGHSTLKIDNKESVITAIDTFGHFNSTSAIEANNRETANHSIWLSGHVVLNNSQSYNEELSREYGTYAYGLNIENFSIETKEALNTTSLEINSSVNGFNKIKDVYAIGVNATNSVLEIAHPLTINVRGEGNNTIQGILLKSNSIFKASNDIKIISIAGNTLGEAISADETSSVSLLNQPEQKNTNTTIVGDISIAMGGNLTIDRTDTFSLYGAITANNETDSIRLSSRNASWIISSDSVVNNLELNAATLSFDQSDAKTITDAYGILTGNQFNKLTVHSLSLSNQATLRFKVDLSDETTATDIIHAQKVDGTGIADIKLVGSVTEHKAMSEGVGFLYQDEGTLTLRLPDRNNDGTPDQVIYQNGGIMGWKLAYQATEQENTEAEQTQIDLPEMTDGTVTGTGKGYWYLTTGDYAELPDEPDPTPDPDPNPDPNPDPDPTPEPTPDPDPLPPEAQQIQNLGSSVAQAVGWLSEKNDLRRRLGEVRYGTQTGAWAKVFNRQDRAQGFRYNGFKQESTGVHIGYDPFVNQTAEASWLIGATLRYAHSKQEGLETAYGGDGKLNEYSAKVYATWLHQSGAYMDVLAQIGYYDQEINGLNNSAEAVFDANYHNWGMGVSAEIGHKLPLGPQGQSNTWTSNWFIEPQLELSYFYVKGDDFTTSTGLKVNQGNADFLTGRLGFVLGKKVSYGPSEAVDKRWYQFGLIGGMNHEFLGDQTIRFTGVDGAVADVKGHGLGGTSFYYGITADWQVSDKLRIYGELDREEGDHYTKDYGINVGIKYAF